MQQRPIRSEPPRGRLPPISPICAIVAALLAFAPHAQATPSNPAADPAKRLTLYVPASPGGGAEQMAVAMKAALEDEGLVRDVKIVERPGGGGLVGLTEFLEGRRGDPHALLVGGMGIIYSAKVNGSQVTPLDATPIARLARDYYAVAVPDRSPLHTAGDLVATLRSRPYDLHWTGDQPQGGAERLVWRLASVAHVAPLVQPYSPRFGAGQVADFLQHGDPNLVGVAGLGELAPAMPGGNIRILGVAAPGPNFAGEPTLQAQGLDIVSANWRGVFAPPDISAKQRQDLVALVTAMAHSTVWQETLRRRDWDDCFLAGEGFSTFLAEEQQRVFADNLPDGGTAAVPAVAVPKSSAERPWLWGAVAAGLALAALGAMVWRMGRTTRTRWLLSATLEPLGPGPPVAPAPASQSPVVQAIDREFDAWKLSAAERDVAWFLLKGLPMKEIARLRGASERTVRQQARAVYSKAGLDGRSDLSAHILEHCLAPAPGVSSQSVA